MHVKGDEGYNAAIGKEDKTRNSRRPDGLPRDKIGEMEALFLALTREDDVIGHMTNIRQNNGEESQSYHKEK